MFPDSPFAVPRSSFERPVPLVLVDPDQSPTVCLSINRDWIPYILGSLKQLVLQTTWRTDDPDALNLVQARAMTLIAMFQQALREPGCEDRCQEFPTGDPRFNWLPGNPYTNPGDVPDGYHFPPWYVAPEHTLIPGIKPGDVVTDVLHAPFNPLASGFPRFRLAVEGSGTVEIKFVRFPTASIALWTVDGNIGAARWTDLHVSLEAAIGSFDPEMVIPIEIEGMGPHVLDVSIIASISEDPPFVHFGGGIRAISLCGFDMPEPKPTFIDELEYEMSICEQLRFHDGKLQGLCCGDWTDIPGFQQAVADSAVQPGAGGTVPLGDCKEYDVVLSANNQWRLPVPVQGGTTITVTLASGGWTDGSVAWFCPQGTGYALGFCGDDVPGDPGDPLPSVNHMRLLGQLSSGPTYVDMYNTTYTVPSGQPSQDFLFQANDATLGDNHGSVSFHVKVCAPTTATWCAKFNAANGWGTIVGSSGGGAGCAPVLVSGVWHSCTGTDSNQKLRIAFTGETGEGTVITHIADTGTTTDSDPNGRAIQITIGASTSYSQQPGGSGTFHDFLDGSFTGTFDIQWAANANGGGAATTMAEVVISGTGPAPDWATGFNC